MGKLDHFVEDFPSFAEKGKLPQVSKRKLTFSYRNMEVGLVIKEH